MKIGCHGLVWTGLFDAAGIRHSVNKTKEAGFDLIEFPLMDPFAFDVEAAKSALKDYDLGATGSLGLSAEADISSEDPDVVRTGELLLNRALDVVAEVGGTDLCGVIYCGMKKYLEPVSSQGLHNSMAVIGRVSDRAADLGVNVSVEVVNRYESNILNTARQALKYVQELGRANLGVHLDTYHMNIEESDMFSPVLNTAEALRYVHIGESHRGYLGTGNVDFDTFFKALGHVGYDGPVVFESFSSAVIAPDVAGMLGIWRNLWDNSEELGAHANAYIRDRFTAVNTIALH